MPASSAVRKAEVSKIAIAANDDLPTEDMIKADEGIAAIEDAIRLSQAKGHPVVIRVLISPVTAAWLLGQNEQNRVLSEPKITQYATDIKEGRWMENGDGIGVATCMTLNNGQHRCHGVICSGISITTNVTVGLKREARMTNDIGLQRTMSNIFAMAGIENHSIVGVMTKLIIGWEETATAAKRPTRESSVTRVLEYMMNDPSIAESAVYVRSLKVPKGFLSKAQIGFFHNILKKHDAAHVEEFLSALVTGNEDGRGLRVEDPRNVVRVRLITEHKMFNHADRVELVFRAWNAWREGRDIAKARITGNLPDLV